MSLTSLFSPLSIKSLDLPNRVVMPAMTRGFAADGVPMKDVAAYYRRRAEGGVGLIITEGVGIDRPTSVNEANYPRMHGEAPLAAWKAIVDEVHAAGGRIAPQLWHVGAAPGEAAKDNIDSPSGIFAPGHPVGPPMTEEDIADTIAAFARAAGEAKCIGFDAVQFHAAHGYLIDQFFWKETNLRTDRFGGASLAERSRFAIEIVKATREAVGPDFPVIMRVSQWKQQDYEVKMALDPAELEAWLGPLADAGTDIFDCSQRRFWEPEFEGSSLNFAGWAKRVTGKPTITVGSVGLSGEFMASYEGEGSEVRSIDGLLQRLDAGEFDLVAVGRALLDDPEWLKKIKDGRLGELRAYDPRAMETLF